MKIYILEFDHHGKVATLALYDRLGRMKSKIQMRRKWLPKDCKAGDRIKISLHGESQ